MWSRKCEVTACKLFLFNVLLKDEDRSTHNLCNYRITVLSKAFAEDAYSCYGFQFSDEEKYACLLELTFTASALNRDL